MGPAKAGERVVRGPEGRHRNGERGDMLQDGSSRIPAAVLHKTIQPSPPHERQDRAKGMGLRLGVGRTPDDLGSNVHARQEAGCKQYGCREKRGLSQIAGRDAVGLGPGGRGAAQLHSTTVGPFPPTLESVRPEK